MDIKEAKKLLRQLEQNIAQLIHEFEKETDLCIVDIDIKCANYANGKSETIGVEIKSVIDSY